MMGEIFYGFGIGVCMGFIFNFLNNRWKYFIVFMCLTVIILSSLVGHTTLVGSFDTNLLFFISEIIGVLAGNHLEESYEVKFTE